ncbi:hypothetical protein N7520_011080 [Penicillium odoratum]|uniref:uncharacterized protein n=1 Tax=Penicillium odoratum TaxID=1167516 RepID=UPI0025497B97|nr:uncharacterized protein N7520_011080 [Penicillium odoratum]KAJ5745898.1 hypothetical protein N7520_011080 [Penicillium odoratum]
MHRERCHSRKNNVPVDFGHYTTTALGKLQGGCGQGRHHSDFGIQSESFGATDNELVENYFRGARRTVLIRE